MPLFGWGIVLVGLVIAWAVARALKLSGPTLGAFMLVAVFGNTGYVGYPLASAMLGDSGLVRAVFSDVFGNTMAVVIVGTLIAARFGEHDVKVNPIREIVIFGELLAISAIVMCLLFVLVDIGRPDRFWHLIPPWGHLNFPHSVLAWDVLVLNIYLLINFAVATHILYRAFHGRHYAKQLVIPLVLLSIPMAVGIHTVTAFLYNGLAARPYWNSSILAPQFLASAFCSGPAILIIVMQLLRRFTRFEIRDEAIWKIAELMAYAMFLNLFLHGAEVFKEFYSDTQHLLYTRYWYLGLGAHRTMVPYAWSAVGLNLLAFILFIAPATRRHWVTLNIGCLATYAAVYIEKGMGLIIPGLTPDALGEVYEYYPTITELRIAGGIFALGFLVFTLMLKVAVPITLGEFLQEKPAQPR
jgi:molybdopterin-containing oxidoreductase family membrane subunit